MLIPPISRYMTAQPWTIASDQSLLDAHALMHEHGIRHLPVVDHGKLVGIVSDRDLRIAEAVGGSYLARLADTMTDPVFAVTPATPVDEVVRTMSERKYGAAVITRNDGSIDGIFTMVDACRAFADVLDRMD